MGGGTPNFHKRRDGRDLAGEFRKSGYAVWTSRDEMMRGDVPDRILGTFWDGHLPYTIDRDNSPEIAKQVPTLAEMTKTALEALSRNEKGFLLQVEGGRVDHAAHGNDGAALLWDQLAFDDAVGVAVEWALERGDTLVVVTSDHGNANPGLNGIGPGYNDAGPGIAKLGFSTGSFDVISAELREAAKAGDVDAGVVGSVVRRRTGVELDPSELGPLAAAWNKDMPFEMNELHRSFGALLGQALGNHTGVMFTGSNHTEDMTLIAAVGPGRQRFHGRLRNTDAFGIMAGFMGIRFRNPSMTPEQAKKALAAAPAIVERPHWA